tara:strand:- start:1352 stop:1585 length:234 start_codon:yes stop_codon:yes gene_type:complete
VTKIDWDHNNGIVTMVPLTREELECVRVCVANAPIPYDITKKKIPGDILQKIGYPKKIKHEGIAKVKYDLRPYGIFN